MFTAVTIQNSAGADVSLFNGQRRLGECHGLHGLPAPRRVSRPRPGGHGEINETRHYASRQPVWNGQLTGSDEAALWAEYDAILAALWDAVSEPRLLKWTRHDGATLQSMVKLGEAFDPVIKASDAGRVLAYQLIFDREDPRNYAQTQRSAVGGALVDSGGGLGFPFGFPFSFTATGGGDVTVTNAGTADTPAVLTVHGYVANPQIQQVDTGRVIVLSGELAAGGTLVVDGFERTVLLDGVTDRGNLVDFAGTDWDAAMIPPGTSTYRLLASSWDSSARLDVASRDAYA